MSSIGEAPSAGACDDAEPERGEPNQKEKHRRICRRVGLLHRALTCHRAMPIAWERADEADEEVWLSAGPLLSAVECRVARAARTGAWEEVTKKSAFIDWISPGITKKVITAESVVGLPGRVDFFAPRSSLLRRAGFRPPPRWRAEELYEHRDFHQNHEGERPMPKYMLLLHDDPTGFASLSPEQMQKVIEKYIAWGDRLRAAKILTDGQKLTDDAGRVLRRKNGRLQATDGPHSETKEVLGGYYTIEAADYNQAVERASDCPQLEYGGSIEIRQIDVV